MLSMKEIVIITERMDRFINESEQVLTVFGNDRKIPSHKIYNIYTGEIIDAQLVVDLRTCAGSMLGRLYFATLLEKKKSGNSPDADYDVVNEGFVKVFTKNHTITYIKKIDNENLIFLSLEEDYARIVFKLAA